MFASSPNEYLSVLMQSRMQETLTSLMFNFNFLFQCPLKGRFSNV
jgi:hypothetical protein